jgi:hypothetical protein
MTEGSEFESWWGQEFSLLHVQTSSRVHPTSYPMGSEDSFPRGKSGCGVKLTTYLQLVPRSRKRGSMHPLPHTPWWRNAYLVKHRDNFTFTFIMHHSELYDGVFLCQCLSRNHMVEFVVMNIHTMLLIPFHFDHIFHKNYYHLEFHWGVFCLSIHQQSHAWVHGQRYPDCVATSHSALIT